MLEEQIWKDVGRCSQSKADLSLIISTSCYMRSILGPGDQIAAFALPLQGLTWLPTLC